MGILVLLLMLAAFGAWQLKSVNQARRIALLDSFLGRYQLEKRMQDLIQAYLGPLEESDPVRQARLRAMLDLAEERLCGQFRCFVVDFFSGRRSGCPRQQAAGMSARS